MLISILIPTYNEENNIVPLVEAILEIFKKEQAHYNYEIVFIDNNSSDNTQIKIEQLCKQNLNIKAIFNANNFGPLNSPFYGLCQTNGDCTIMMSADFQDPVEMISKFIQEWENGYKIVCGIKTDSQENKLMYFIRSCYYKIIKKMSSIKQIEHFTGFGLYDKTFIDVLKTLDDPTPFIRGIVAELGFKRKDIVFTQPKRLNGKSHSNFYNLYDYAMLGFTSYTKIGLRIATFLGFLCSVISIIIAIIYFIYKLIHWDYFLAGMAPLIIGVFLLGGLQLFFIGLIGEYILTINSRVMKRPLVIEEKRINFHKDSSSE